MYNLSVVILSKNKSNFFACADAVRRNEPDLRIILVDDGVGELPELEPIIGVHGKKPFCFARNANIGIEAAGEDDVLLLNDDALLRTVGGFSILHQAAYDQPSYGVIASTTNLVGNTNQWPQGKGLREDERQVCFVCVLIPRRTIDLIGCLDERFTAYGFEDDDYCLRVRRAGLRIGIDDRCFVDHASLHSTFRGDPKRPVKLHEGLRIFVDKWGSHPL